MQQAWTALAAFGAVAAACMPYLVFRNQQKARWAETQFVRCEADLQRVHTAINCLNRLRADLESVIRHGPLGAGRLAALNLHQRLDRLERTLAVQPLPQKDLDMLRHDVGNVLHCGQDGSQQAAARHGLQSLHTLTDELRRRERELASEVSALMNM